MRKWLIPLVAAAVATPLLYKLSPSSPWAPAIPAQEQTQQTWPTTGYTLVQEQTLEQVYQNSTAASVRVNVGDSGIGSGFFISSDGLVLTAAHVALGDGNLSITMEAGRSYPAKLVGFEEYQDLALLQVSGNNFPFLKLSPTPVKVGDSVVAIGNSRGRFDGGKTGRVIRLDARLDPTFPSGLVATTMPLAPGDSGGPVLNSKGEVVGVSVAVGTVRGEFSSYYKPVNTSSAIVNELKAGLRRGVPILGISVADATRYLEQSGALITDVREGLGAQRAGLREPQVETYRDEQGRMQQNFVGADVIVGVDGHSVRTPRDLIAYLHGKKPGDQVKLQVLRGNQTIEIMVILSEKTVG